MNKGRVQADTGRSKWTKGRFKRKIERMDTRDVQTRERSGH